MSNYTRMVPTLPDRMYTIPLVHTGNGINTRYNMVWYVRPTAVGIQYQVQYDVVRPTAVVKVRSKARRGTLSTTHETIKLKHVPQKGCACRRGVEGGSLLRIFSRTADSHGTLAHVMTQKANNHHNTAPHRTALPSLMMPPASQP